MKRLAIFGSGSGTNAENIIKYFKDNTEIKVALVLSNKPDAFILERGRKAAIPSVSFNKKDLNEMGLVLNLLKKHHIDFIILAGFMKLIPEKMIAAYQDRIINIHPALLPGFGGKDMYGDKVHESVIASGAIISGITIHHVNKNFDDGEIIFQAACHIAKDDNSETLANKIHKLEYMYYPVVIEKLLKIDKRSNLT